jgi:hypothetical protein
MEPIDPIELIKCTQNKEAIYCYNKKTGKQHQITGYALEYRKGNLLIIYNIELDYKHFHRASDYTLEPPQTPYEELKILSDSIPDYSYEAVDKLT